MAQLVPVNPSLKKDTRGLVFHIGIVSIVGLLFVFMAFLGWVMHGQDLGMDTMLGVLWDWSWLFAAIGAMLLALRIPDFRIVLGIPLIVGVLWYFVVMG